MSALILAGLALGAVKAIANANARNEEYRDKVNSLREKQEDLAVSKSNLTASYNLSYGQNVSSANETISGLEANIADTQLNQNRSLRQSITGADMQDTLQNMQIAELQIQASEAQGQAVQQASMSGFQNSGSAMNAQRKTDEASARAINQATQQRAITRFSNFSSAVNNYTSAEQQKASYGRQIESTKNELDRTLQSLNLNYSQSMNQIETEQRRNDAELDYAEGDGRRQFALNSFLGAVSDIGGTMLSFASL